MNPRDFTLALLHDDDLMARQLVKDATRAGFSWSQAPAPDFAGCRTRAIYASVVELLATRAGQVPPAWTERVGPAPAPVFLVKSAKTSKAMHKASLESTPECLKKRNIFALRDYLNVL
jgi:hypothetical protein